MMRADPCTIDLQHELARLYSGQQKSTVFATHGFSPFDTQGDTLKWGAGGCHDTSSEGRYAVWSNHVGELRLRVCPYTDRGSIDDDGRNPEVDAMAGSN
jgi:hypothetical protein